MSSMKIAFLVDQFPRSSQPFIVNQITGVHDRGHNIRIYATGRPDEGDWAEVPNEVTEQTTYTSIPYNKRKRVLKGLKILIRYFSKDPFTIARTLNPARFRADALSLRPLYRLAPMLGEDIDILHCHFATRGRLGAILKQSGLDAKLVTSVHGYGLRMAEKNPSRYKNLFSVGDCFLVNSQNTYRRLRACGVDEHRIVHHPVGIAVEEFPFRQTKPVETVSGPINILTVARLEEIKGIEYGLRAVQKFIQSSDTEIKYHLIGDGSQRGAFERLTQQLGISEHVRFHGHQTRSDVISQMYESDIFLLPSIEEAFGMVLIEAQAVGLPVIATSVGGIPEAVNAPESARLVPPRDPDAIVSALHELIEMQDQWLEIGTAGREYVAQQFDIDKLNDSLTTIYEDLLTAE